MSSTSQAPPTCWKWKSVGALKPRNPWAGTSVRSRKVKDTGVNVLRAVLSGVNAASEKVERMKDANGCEASQLNSKAQVFSAAVGSLGET
eukprot:CAMPEP_0203888036 /NCGR_PEP_ID=MMETSP0359-20131031/31677_1 /ASSEMBLY_ACC=CAM_ASM_000338 /TAXON_ID=268821 /ORGANISM="Scrippsiella Hangoei, Strain SHTV-5" /LENGTH=89 /DNA_ID=CAMNT_0050809157 /DNA_START=168 /DNA_END=433 /DNA_ORIENTATION=+